MVDETLPIFYFPVLLLCANPGFLWEKERKYCHNKGDDRETWE